MCHPGRGHRKWKRDAVTIKQTLFKLCVCVYIYSKCTHLLFFSFTLSLTLPHTQGGIIDNHRVWGHGTGNQGCLGNGALLIKWSSSLSTCGSEVDRVFQLSLLFCSAFMFLFHSLPHPNPHQVFVTPTWVILIFHLFLFLYDVVYHSHIYYSCSKTKIESPWHLNSLVFLL